MELLTVKCKETGDELVIKAFRFNPDLHEKVEAEKKEKKVVKEEVVEEVAEDMPKRKPGRPKKK